MTAFLPALAEVLRRGKDAAVDAGVALSPRLDVHRPTVTVAAAALRDRGLIGYQRGRSAILDRLGLEAAACEGYGVYADESARLRGPVAERA